LIGLCVAAEWPRPAVERALLGQLEQELRRLGDRIQVVVPESNLSAQLLLHGVGYRATQVLRGRYGSEDGYLMVWPQPGPARQAERVPSHAAEGGVTGKPNPTRTSAEGTTGVGWRGPGGRPRRSGNVRVAVRIPLP